MSRILLLSAGLVTGLDWTIQYKGTKYVNLHEDPDHVKTPCTRENSICVPITFSVLYCDLLNSADRKVEVGVSPQILNNPNALNLDQGHIEEIFLRILL